MMKTMKNAKHKLLSVVLAASLLLGFIPCENTKAVVVEPQIGTMNITVYINWEESFELLEKTNKERREAGIAPLVMDANLCEVAIYRVAETSLTPGHIAADDVNLTKEGKRYEYMGLTIDFNEANENQHYCLGGPSYDKFTNQVFSSVDRIYNGYKNSQSHHNNYMRNDWNTVGIAVGVNDYGLFANPEVFARKDTNKIKPLKQSDKPKIEKRTISVRFLKNKFDYYISKNVRSREGYFQGFVRKVLNEGVTDEDCSNYYNASEDINDKTITIYKGETTYLGDYVQPSDYWYSNAYDEIVGAGRVVEYNQGTENYWKETVKTFQQNYAFTDYSSGYALTHCKPIDWSNLTFSSKNSNIVSVNTNSGENYGKITGVEVGETTITTNFKGISGLTHTYKVKVIPIPEVPPTPTPFREYHQPEPVVPADPIPDQDPQGEPVWNPGVIGPDATTVPDTPVPQDPTPTPKPKTTWRPATPVPTPVVTDVPTPAVTAAPTPYLPYVTSVPVPSYTQEPYVPSDSDMPMINNEPTNVAQTSLGLPKYTEYQILKGNFKKGDLVQKYVRGRWNKATKLTKNTKEYKTTDTKKNYRIVRKDKKKGLILVKSKTSFSLKLTPKVDGKFGKTLVKTLKNKKKGTSVKVYNAATKKYEQVFKTKRKYAKIEIYGISKMKIKA